MYVLTYIANGVRDTAEMYIVFNSPLNLYPASTLGYSPVPSEMTGESGGGLPVQHWIIVEVWLTT